MRKLVIVTLVFLLPVAGVIILLPVSERQKYQGLKDDCFNHGIWIHDRIYHNDKPIDIAFLGSSHTINGINDKEISRLLQNRQAVNLGYCRLGRNLSYVLLKDLMAGKHIEHLVLEVRQTESRYSHPIFPHVAATRDVMLANPFFNKDALSDIWTHFAYKIELVQDILFQQEEAAPIRMQDYGFASSKDTASTALLNETKLKRSQPKNPMTNLERNFHSTYARFYLKKIHRLCDRNNIRITFLYLPSYGVPDERPAEYEIYKKYGNVFLPPRHILENQANWYDENHLNQIGANKLSIWVGEQIRNHEQ